MNKDFWSDVLRSGAILGFVMSLSHIFEQYLLAFGELDVIKASTICGVEWLVAAVVFIWLLVRFTKRRAMAVPSEMMVTYSYLLSFIILISMLAGVLVGVADTLFISVMGYDNFILGLINYYDGFAEFIVTNMSTLPVSGEPNPDPAVADQIDLFLSNFEQLTTQLRQSEQPSIGATVFSKLQTYSLAGIVPGFVIAGVVSSRRRRSGMRM